MRTMNLYKQVAPGTFHVARVPLNDSGAETLARAYNLNQTAWTRRRVTEALGKRGFYPRAHFDPGCKRTWRRGNTFTVVRNV